MNKLSKTLLASLLVCGALSAGPQQATQDTTMKQQRSAPCAKLSKAEQDFATQLSPIHKQIFCQSFTGEQRAQVLALMLSGNRRSQPMSADEAVEKVIKDSRMQKDDQQQQGQAKKSPPPPRSSYRSTAEARRARRSSRTT